MNIFSKIFHKVFSSKKKKSELVMVLDVGSSSVGGALFETNAGGAPNILSIREPIVLEDKSDFDRFLSLTVKALDSVVDKISKAGFGAPHRVFCVLSSPWYASQTRVITSEKAEPFLFTKKLADVVIADEVNIFDKEYLAKYAHPADKVRTLELKTIKTTLNGYETSNPYNQKTKQFQINIFVSVSPEQVLVKIEEAINKSFHLLEIKFSSFVMASYVVARDVFAHQENFLLIDIGGEVTDTSMVKGNVLRESISFPAGSNFMIRGVAAGMKCTLEEARSLLFLYKDGHAVGEVQKNLKPIVAGLKQGWLQMFQESLANLSNDISIPSRIFLAIDKEFYDFFTDVIKTEQFNQYTLTDSKFEVSHLGTEALNGITTFRAEIPRDPFMILETIYINRFFH